MVVRPVLGGLRREYVEVALWWEGGADDALPPRTLSPDLFSLSENR